VAITPPSPIEYSMRSAVTRVANPKIVVSLSLQIRPGPRSWRCAPAVRPTPVGNAVPDWFERGREPGCPRSARPRVWGNGGPPTITHCISTTTVAATVSAAQGACGRRLPTPSA
jgi:hypothetical protein